MNKKYKFLLTGLLFSFLFFPFFQTSQAGFFDWFKWFGWFKNSESQSTPLDNLAVKQYTLLISKVGSGSLTSDDGKINCGNEDSCGKIYTYAAGSKVTLTALPNSGYVLGKWNDCDSSSGNKCEITINKSRTVTLKFVQKAKGFSNVPQKSSSSGKLSSSKSSAVSSKTASSKAFSSSESSNSVSRSSKSSSNYSQASSPKFSPSASNKIVIDSCQEITKSGDYVLDKDLTSNGICVTIKNSKNINLNCDNHSIFSNKTESGAIKIENVDIFSIKSCDLKANIGTVRQTGENFDKEVIWHSLFIVNSSNGEISNNTLRGASVNVFSDPPGYSLESYNLKIINNYFTEGYKQDYTHNSVISNNKIKISALATFSAYGISSDHGSNNIIKNNNVDGGWDGTFTINTKIGKKSGIDDGIFLGNENNDIVEQNTLMNYYDCGIETMGLITETNIRNNTIDNVGVCGIGAWYANSWKNNTVEANKISNAPKMFLFYRHFGLQSDEDKVYFLNNIFKNNKISNFKYVQDEQADTSSIFAFQNFDSSSGRTITPSDVIVGGNILTGNYFGYLSAPRIQPLGGLIIDGGNNICGKIMDGTENYPLKCS